MEEINKFLYFINDNINDDRISVYKEMKNGCRYYYISILLKSKQEDNSKKFNSYNQLSITLDNRNKCIVMNSACDEKAITIEDENTLNKWSGIFEKHLNQNIDNDIKDMIHDVMSDSEDLYRDYQVKKILKKDESI